MMAEALTEPQSAVAAEADRLVVQLPPGVERIVITREAFEDVMGAAADMWVANLPDTPAMVTMHLAIKSAARAMLWFMAKSPLPGMPEPPKLSRNDDAIVVVVRFMLSWLFGVALRTRGGQHDLAAVALGALSAGNGSVPLNGWDKFAASVGRLVAAAPYVDSGNAVLASGSDREGTGGAEAKRDASQPASDDATTEEPATHASVA